MDTDLVGDLLALRVVAAEIVYLCSFYLESGSECCFSLFSSFTVIQMSRVVRMKHPCA